MKSLSCEFIHDIVSNSSHMKDMVSDVILFFRPLENGQYPLVLTVKEKDDPLGQVVVPLINLPVKEFSKKVTVPLKPHKKCPHPEGELTYEAWISKKTPSIVCSTELETHPSPLFKLKHHLRKSPLLHRKNHASKLSSDDLQVNNSLTDSKVAFRSMQDLSNSTFHVQVSRNLVYGFQHTLDQYMVSNVFVTIYP